MKTETKQNETTVQEKKIQENTHKKKDIWMISKMEKKEKYPRYAKKKIIIIMIIINIAETKEKEDRK